MGPVAPVHLVHHTGDEMVAGERIAAPEVGCMIVANPGPEAVVVGTVAGHTPTALEKHYKNVEGVEVRHKKAAGSVAAGAAGGTARQAHHA